MARRRSKIEVKKTKVKKNVRRSERIRLLNKDSGEEIKFEQTGEAARKVTVQIPTKKRKDNLNKAVRKDCEPPSKKAKNGGGMRLTSFTKYQSSYFWKFLRIGGPFQPIYLLSFKFFARRSLLHTIREICVQLYQNFEEYLKNELVTLGASKAALNSENLLSYVAKMSKKTMKYEKDGMSMIFYTENFLPIIRNSLNGSSTVIHFDDCSELLEQLRHIFKHRNVEVTELELGRTRNLFVDYLINIQYDLIDTLVTFSNGSTNPRRRHRDLLSPDGFLNHSNHDALLSFSNLPYLNFKFMCRSGVATSFWSIIPCEAKEHLLEHVFTYGLLECLPENVKEFLGEWMLTVRNRMRMISREKDLENNLKELLLPSNNGTIGWDSPIIRNLLEPVYNEVLNCKGEFNVFDPMWLDVFLEILGDPECAWDNGHHILASFIEDVASSTSPGFDHLSSLFPDADVSYNLLRHVKIQLFHFFLLFCYHTIRYAFHVSIKKRQMMFNGLVECRIVQNFAKIDMEEEMLPKSNVLRAPVDNWDQHRNDQLPSQSMDQDLATSGFQNENFNDPIPFHPPEPALLDAMQPPPSHHLIQNAVPFNGMHHPNHNAPIDPPVHRPPIHIVPIDPSAAAIGNRAPFQIKNEPIDSEVRVERTEEQVHSGQAHPPPQQLPNIGEAFKALLDWNQALQRQVNEINERFRSFC